MIILVVGVPASGKTSVVNAAKKYFKKEIEVIEFGDIIFELAKKNYGIENRDEIRKKLSVKDQTELQLEAVGYILDKCMKGDVIVTTHFVIETSSGFKSGINKEMADLLKPDAIVIIISDPDKILLRRVEDTSRVREKEDLERIRIHQEMTIYYAIPFMYMYNTVIEVIKNEEGLLEVAAKKFADFINNLLEEKR
ncbi:MAG: hypothetical protein BXU00_00515 [Candidatus Nanoclepta minutus]|uniref:Adenylate kinase n=1 Tax=Candidatus Nanoclepta minutus TaxID=1940235 RepID=A0A397WPV2_9ARCH|nr:MAG: hypothetical protein BXU00_00515 [Candidatus Nanoclepta minutus]